MRPAHSSKLAPFPSQLSPSVSAMTGALLTIESASKPQAVEGFADRQPGLAVDKGWATCRVEIGLDGMGEFCLAGAVIGESKQAPGQLHRTRGQGPGVGTADRGRPD
jgi:hypothetical protein